MITELKTKPLLPNVFLIKDDFTNMAPTENTFYLMTIFAISLKRCHENFKYCIAIYFYFAAVASISNIFILITNLKRYHGFPNVFLFKDDFANKAPTENTFYLMTPFL